jgi:hypothetical protein
MFDYPINAEGDSHANAPTAQFAFAGSAGAGDRCLAVPARGRTGQLRPCGEPADAEMAEMYDPSWPDDRPSVFCHAQCGIDAGLELA